MDLESICSVCIRIASVLHRLDDSLKPPRDMQFDGAKQLEAGFRKVLKVDNYKGQTPLQACVPCHNKFRQIYAFMNQCATSELRLSQLRLKTKSLTVKPELINKIEDDRDDTNGNISFNDVPLIAEAWKEIQTAPLLKDPLGDIEDADADYNERLTAHDSLKTDETIDNDSLLKSHRPVHFENVFECNECPKKFSNRKSLKYHQRLHTGEIKCNDCGAKFTRMHNLSIHSRIHTGETFNCDLCDAKFTQLRQLTRHMHVHTGVKPFACDECESTFTTIDSLRVHKRIHAGKTFDCNDCELKFKSQHLLRMHRAIHKRYSFHCDECDAKFTRENSLTYHRKIHMKSEAGESLNCDKSQTKYTNLRALKDHSYPHKTGRFDCDRCDEKFKRSVLLKEHMWLHMDETFDCDRCDDQFFTRRLLSEHKLTHRNETTEVVDENDRKMDVDGDMDQEGENFDEP